MKNNSITLTVFLFSLVFTINTFAEQNLKLEKSKGGVEFIAKGPLVRVSGKGEGVSGELKVAEGKASGVLLLNLKSLNTGISLRDDHMKKKYLQVEKYPTAKITLKNIILPHKLKGRIKFKGLLDLHGVTKEILGTVKLKGAKKGHVQLDADFKIQFSDFGIELPSFKLVSVGE